MLEASNDVAVIYPLTQQFRKTVRYREAEDFDGWLENALSCGVKGFETFAMGFDEDRVCEWVCAAPKAT